MLRRVAPAAAIGGTLILVLTAHLSADTKTVEKPMFNGNRLDWCANWGADCGKPAAQAWCVAQGFKGVESFSKDPRIGESSPTRLIATGAICDDAKCHGFAEITCIKLDTVGPGSTEAAAVPTLAEPPAVSPQSKETATPAPDAGTPVAAATPAPTPGPAPEPRTAAVEPQATIPEAPALPGAPNKEVPAVRVISPANAAVEPETTGATSVQPVAATLATPAEQPEDGPPPPDTAVLAAAGAPPLKPVIEVFETPTFNGRRLDWCRGWKDRCGKATADEFCRLNGFVEAISFAPDPKIGATDPTRQIASGLVCDHEGCDGFAEIACTK
ncbi:MAG TPA: hypothetical protein VFK86_00830 [Bauldia sp.]|nr:hypothetical protein [Bauldia sp.]